MPILFVNGKRRGLRIRGRATVSNPTRRKSRRAFPYIGPPARPKAKSTYRKRVWLTPYKKGVPMPFLAAYRAKKKNPARKRRSRRTLSPAQIRAAMGLSSKRRKGARPQRYGGWVEDVSPSGEHLGWFNAAAMKKARRGKNKRGRRARRSPALRRRTHPAHQRHAPGARLQWENGRWVTVKNKHRSKSMAKRSSTARRRAALKGIRRKRMKKVWGARRRAGKMGPIGRTRRRRRSSSKRRSRARRTHHKRRSRRSAHSRRRRRRTIHTMVHGVRVTRRSRRRRKGRRATKRMSSRRMHMLLGPEAATVRMNPGRRRRKRRRSHHSRRRYYSRRRHRRSRRSHRRRSYRRYRRNPGIRDMFSGIKRVIPLAVSFLANRMAVNKLGPMLPVVSSLGTLQGPLLSLGTMFLTDVLTNRVAFLKRHRDEALLGSRFQLLASLWSAFAPASIQSAVGDYVNMGDYVAVGGAPPLNERFTLSDYVAVGGDGVEEELGMGVSEELGVEEELGNVLLGGLPGPVSGSQGMLKPVPAQQFISPIPARSFTKGIPAVTHQYDASADLYSGIFGGKFGGGG